LHNNDGSPLSLNKGGTYACIQSVRTLRQSFKAKAEHHPVKEIDQEAAEKFNWVLGELKKRYPDNKLVTQMQPLTPHRTQLAGLWAKLDLLEDCLGAL
jgi:hypothetical protein